MNRPLGWDYCLFLVDRCFHARAPSFVPHETLIDLFGHADVPERKVIAKLKKFHKEILLATQGRIKARFVVADTPIGQKKTLETGRRPLAENRLVRSKIRLFLVWGKLISRTGIKGHLGL